MISTCAVTHKRHARRGTWNAWVDIKIYYYYYTRTLTTFIQVVFKHMGILYVANINHIAIMHRRIRFVQPCKRVRFYSAAKTKFGQKVILLQNNLER